MVTQVQTLLNRDFTVSLQQYFTMVMFLVNLTLAKVETERKMI